MVTPKEKEYAPRGGLVKEPHIDSLVLTSAENELAGGFEEIESIVTRGIEEGQMPGAVVVIADKDRVLYERAFGDRQVEPTQESMTLDTVFDMASLTKPVATATSVMPWFAAR